jgi:preprotein translocase subunit YajC
LAQLIVIVAMFVLLWLFLIAPQRRRLQEQRKLIQSVEVGDEILTVGGIIGRVLAEQSDDELLVEIAPGTEVRVARRAVAAVVPPEEPEEPAAPEELEPAEEAASPEAGNLEPNEEIRS